MVGVEGGWKSDGGDRNMDVAYNEASWGGPEGGGEGGRGLDGEINEVMMEEFVSEGEMMTSGEEAGEERGVP